jgi:hypothetical protein
MTQVDWLFIRGFLCCAGIGWCLASFVINADDIVYLAREFVWWLRDWLGSLGYQSFGEYAAAKDLRIALESLERDYKTLCGVTIVLPFREEPTLSREVAR